MRDSQPGLGMTAASLLALTVTLLVVGAGCRRPEPAPAAPAASAAPQPRVVASIQEIMSGMVDPAADAVWGAVGTTITAAGTAEHRPRNDAEWQQVRLQALALLESTNLLMMPGRRVVAQGSRITDEGWQGVLTTEQAEHKLVTDHAAFVQFASALREVTGRMVQAIEARRVEQMVEVGTEMDEVCESCHVVFWYPQQVLPSAPTDLMTKGAAAN